MVEVLRADPPVLPAGERTVASACPLDCPDACSLEVQVHDGRVGTIEGGHANPLTQGFVCGKVRRYADHVYAPERLLYPAVRRGAKGQGRFERISWDEAFDLMVAKISEVRARHGAEAIPPVAYG